MRTFLLVGCALVALATLIAALGISILPACWCSGKLGVRPLTREEEAILPRYDVKAERTQQWVDGIMFGIILLVGLCAIAQSLGY